MTAADRIEDVLPELTKAVRAADKLFDSGSTGGGGTRHWIRDCFVGALEEVGLVVVRADALYLSREDADAIEQALLAWTSMPDAGFNDRDPRWNWWYETARSRQHALARLRAAKGQA